MHWKLQKYLVEETINYLRRVFTYNKEWSNTDVELFKFHQGKGELLYEEFPEVSETYPIVLVSPTGGNFLSSGFNDLVRQVDDDLVQLGERPLSHVQVDGSLVLKSKLPSLDGVSIRGIEIPSAWTGEGVGGDDLSLKIYKNYLTTPQLVATASVPGHTSTEFYTQYIEFSSNLTFDGNPYHILIQSTSDSPYYLPLDTDNTGNYIYNSVTSSGSVVGKLVLPAFLRVGGNYQGGLTFKVQSKNDSKLAYSISELISIYLTLARHGELSRVGAVNGLKLNLVSDVVAEFIKKGVGISDIKIGALEKRKRSDQEVIYSITISVGVLTEWFEDYPLDSITNIDLLLGTYVSKRYKEANLTIDLN